MPNYKVTILGTIVDPKVDVATVQCDGYEFKGESIVFFNSTPYNTTLLIVPQNCAIVINLDENPNIFNKAKKQSK